MEIYAKTMIVRFWFLCAIKLSDFPDWNAILHLFGRPNPPMQPTPLRVDKIRSILASLCAQKAFRSSRAARLMGTPLGHFTTPNLTRLALSEYASPCQSYRIAEAFIHPDTLASSVHPYSVADDVLADGRN
jgi:hypothetical protein